MIAADLHAHRVRAMAERLESAGARNVESIVLDGTKPLRQSKPPIPAPHSGAASLIAFSSDVPCFQERGTLSSAIRRFAGGFAPRISPICTRARSSALLVNALRRSPPLPGGY